MDKNAIKKYAVWARRELIARVSQKAEQYGITEKEIIDERAENIHGVVLTPAQKSQRQALILLIWRDGYQQAMEEVAYTWFNRFIALRFMEVNEYLPGHTRAFTDEQNTFKPKILSDALNLELNGLNLDKVIELKETNKTEELYQYLLITLCNHLSAILPGMFQRIDDYTELLFPEHLLREGSVLEQLVATIPQEDWLDAVQIIGWLYQYYNAEPKDQVFANLKKNIKISKKDIPAATQLFTPDWIVRYMVENSLGRLWVEGHPDDSLKAGWKYYLEEAEQEPDVQAKLQEIRSEYAQMKPEDILCIDPCSGSGHILAYLFDVLVQIYEAYGYPTRDAVASIIRYNLWGMDIDDRAAQLAYFAVMMKARQYDKGWFRRGIEPHVFALQDSPEAGDAFYTFFEEESDTARKVISSFRNAKEYGSIIHLDVTNEELDRLDAKMTAILRKIEQKDLTYMAQAMVIYQTMAVQLRQARALVQKYHVVVTNPPYMGASGMGDKLSQFVKLNYPDSKSDLFAAFIERGLSMVKRNGYNCMVTMQSWMFLSSFEKMRIHILKEKQIATLMHMENMVMHIAFGTVVTVFQNVHISGYRGTYNQIKLRDIVDDGVECPAVFPVPTNRFAQVSSDNFSKIPGAPVAYWLKNFDIFNFKSLSTKLKSGGRIKTHDNELYVRNWWEPSEHSKKWVPYANGGDFRKWYGNHLDVVDWSERARAFYAEHSGLCKEDFWFKEGITWGAITSGDNSYRIKPKEFMFSSAAPSVFGNNYTCDYSILAFLNSKVALYVSQVINPTVNQNVNDTLRLPYYSSGNTTADLGIQCIEISHVDWDSFETSMDFQIHPIVRWSRNFRDATSISATMDYYYGYKPEVHSTVELCYILWQGECNERFKKLKANEEELNRIFINIYDLQDELNPDVDDKNVTVRRADLGRDIRSLVSYAVGCMLGRYSLDTPGLAFAGGEWDASQYHTYPADKDGVLPITDDDYFSDDVVSMFVDWVKTVFGPNELEENLKFIASALYPNGGGTAREMIRQYFLNDFYKDHLKIYQKRPIYWMFDAGKKNSFKCLIYLHRYRPDTVARVRTDYVHEMQARYRTAMEDLTHRVETASGSERVRLQKLLVKIQGQEEELRKYEEKIHHYADMMLPLDLDDGVKVNYAKLADVLAPIK